MGSSEISENTNDTISDIYSLEDFSSKGNLIPNNNVSKGWKNENFW